MAPGFFRTSLTFRLIRVLVALVCFYGFFYQCRQVIQAYFRYDFSVVQSEVVRHGILFPAVTVCIDSWMSVENLCRFRPRNCTKRHMVITYGVFHPQYDSELRNHGSYRPEEIFRCSLKSLDPACKPVDCVKSIERTYYRPPTQLCYTVDPSDNRDFQHCPTPWSWELNLRATWDPAKSMMFFDTLSLPIILHGARTCPPDKLSAVTLRPGMSYALTIKQQQIKRLPSPYKSRCTDYFARGYHKAFRGYLTYDTCMQHCAMLLEAEHCDCVRPLHEFSGSMGLPTCRIQETDTCFRLLNGSGKYHTCNRRCGLPCEETVYDVRMTGIAEEESRENESTFAVTIKFRSDVVDLVRYLPAFTAIELFGYLSGYVGIWFGLSLVKGCRRLERILEDAVTLLSKRRSQNPQTRNRRLAWRSDPLQARILSVIDKQKFVRAINAAET